MKYTFVLILALVALSSSFLLTIPSIRSALQEKCCVSCTLPTIKYYSISHFNDKCGECCLDPKDYAKFKIFEPGLTKAESNTPCADKNFRIYDKTETHGAGSIKVNLDLYSEG